MPNSARKHETLRIGSAPSESLTRRTSAMVRMVRYFVSKVEQEKTIEGRRKVWAEMNRVIYAVDAEDNPFYSDEDRRRIIEGVDNRLRILKALNRDPDAEEVCVQKGREERASGIREKTLPDSDGWTPDFMDSLTRPLGVDK